LPSPGKPLYTKPVDVAGAKYVIRLKSRKDADLAQMTPAKREDLIKDQSYMEAYSLYTAFNKAISRNTRMAARFDESGIPRF